MLTLRRRAYVSLIALSLAAACFKAPAGGAPSPRGDASLAIRFDNDGREHVHVYLIGEKREWLLGRVEAGAVAMLPVPEASLSGNQSFVRLVVIAGEGVTLSAARHARGMPTLAQPVSAILSQDWRFSRGSLSSLAR